MRQSQITMSIDLNDNNEITQVQLRFSEDFEVDPDGVLATYFGSPGVEVPFKTVNSKSSIKTKN